MSHASRRVASFRTSFVAVVGAFSALEGGCSAVLDPTGDTLDPTLCDQPFSTPGCLPSQPDPHCPTAQPDFYSPCSQPGMYCEYGDCYGDPVTQAYCQDGGWIGTVTSCNPPGPIDPPTVNPPPPPASACPVAQPSPGAACAVGAECSYGDCYGFPTMTFRCTVGTWDQPLISTCNPPPPPEPCPLDIPQDDSFCYAIDSCTYVFCGAPLVATCVNNTWRSAVPSCNPPPPECPAAPPSTSTSCTPSGLTCSYSDDPRALCTDGIASYGCTTGVWAQVARGCEPAQLVCPAAQPIANTVCSAGAGTCHYGQFDASCPSGAWNVFVSPLYNPPAPTPCPANLPLQGATCAHIGPSCSYGNCMNGFEADCVNGTWDLHGLTCSP